MIEAEVRLRRLLGRTDEAVRSGKWLDAISQRKLQSYIKAMRQEITLLDEELPSDKPAEKAKRLGLKRQVDRLALQLEQDDFPSAPIFPANNTNEILITSAVERDLPSVHASNRSLLKHRRLSDMRSQLFSHPSSLNLNQSLSQSDHENAGSGAMQEERRVHEELTQGLVQLAQGLRQNALGVEQIVRRDDAVIGEGERLLSANLARLGRETGFLKVLSARSYGTTVIMWIMLAFVLIMFVIALVFIRLFPKRY